VVIRRLSGDDVGSQEFDAPGGFLVIRDQGVV
jgi:hypothetical protein